MLKSMTAYGRAEKSTKQGRFVVEIQTLNRRYLEINPMLPRELASFGPELRKWVQARLFRGKVSIVVDAVYEEQSPVSIAPNLDLVKQIKSAGEKMAHEANVPFTPEVFWNLLLSQQDVLQYETEALDSYHDSLKAVVEEALDHVCEMREKEGLALEMDLRKRVEMLRKCVDEIEKASPEAVLQHREKLMKRLEGFQEEIAESVEREVALLAEKIDIAEEITRFRSHLEQFEELLSGGRNQTGKTLDFLVQELLREVNTMGSKSPDASVVRFVVEVKSELERIREQVQNIE